MEKSFKKLISGYESFRKQFEHNKFNQLQQLAIEGQHPNYMVVACCDSRVDPAVLLQCDLGELFIIRNMANIIPPFEKDDLHHGTSAALEFGINFLKIKHLIILGHSHCGGIKAALEADKLPNNDFIRNWVNQVDTHQCQDTDELAQKSIHASYVNCLSYPWIKEKLSNDTLRIHQWFFNIQTGELSAYCDKQNEYTALDHVYPTFYSGNT